MANQKLTDLVAATTPLAGTEQVYLVQGGVSKRATTQQMADLPGEWSAETVSQAEAEAGTATARRAWTAIRVAQAIAAWWAGSAARTKLDGIASGATANATDEQLRDRSTHTGTQAASTITGLATVATSGAYADLSGRPTLGTAAAANTGTSAGSVPVLDGSGLVPSALLPGFVDDVLEFANVAAFPATGEAGKLYISLATNRQYRWSGSIYVEINPSPGSTDAVPEGSVNLYFTTGRGESAAASWWAASSAKTKLDGIASGATNTPLSDTTPQSPGTAAAGASSSAARGDHVHPLPPVFSTSAAGLAPATGGVTSNFLRADGTWAAPPGGTPGGSNGQLQFNDNGAFGGISTLTTDGSGNLTFSGRWINICNGAASAPASALTGTWFTGGTATTTKPQFLIEPAGTTSTAWSTSGTGLGVNAASGFSGNLLDLQVNGSSSFFVMAGAGYALDPSYGLRRVTNGSTVISGGTIGNSMIDLNGTSVLVNSITFSRSTQDTVLTFDAANTLAQRRSTNAQTFRLYNTFTSATNFERLNVRWAANEAIIDTEAGGGGGILRGLKIGGASTSLLGFYGATPAVQPTAVANATDATTVITQLNALLSCLRTIGIIAT